MNIEFIDTFLKLFGINICTIFTYYKIINSKINNYHQKIFLFAIIIFTALISSFLKIYINNILVSLLNYVFYCLILKRLTKRKFSNCLIITVLSLCISYISFTISSLLIFTILAFTKIINFTNPISFLFIFIIEILLIFNLFKIKRFKDGFSFIKYDNNNDYIEIFVFLTSTIIIFIYFLMGNYKSISLNYLFTGLIVFILILIPILQRTFVLYQKQKLLNKTLKEYETELSETKLKLNTALEEKYKLVKTNHEFYHRQEALKQKLDNISSNLAFNPNLEISEDFGNLLDRINNLSEEYTSKLKPATHLPKTKITELDDMFSYMQSECEKYKIEFILKISNDLNYMIENIIPKNKLETLIGDLIRNSIIAINNNTTNYKSIMVILGFKDNFYEFSVHDSGVEFNVDTLVKLGTKPITTHKDDGGTGIGFITTFETLSSCKGSLIITENIPSDNYYTKSICIKFDNKNNYIINSYRTTEINNLVDSKRNIIINKINN